MSTPCFLLHIGPCCVTEAKGVEELEKRLHAIDYELCWLKQLSKDYKNGVSRGAIAIAVGAMRYVKLLNPPRSTPDISFWESHSPQYRLLCLFGLSI